MTCSQFSKRSPLQLQWTLLLPIQSFEIYSPNSISSPLSQTENPEKEWKHYTSKSNLWKTWIQLLCSLCCCGQLLPMLCTSAMDCSLSIKWLVFKANTELLWDAHILKGHVLYKTKSWIEGQVEFKCNVCFPISPLCAQLIIHKSLSEHDEASLQ